MENRNNEHRMIAAERGNTWAGEEKSGGGRLEAPQKEYLKVSGKKHIQPNERTITSEKLQVRRMEVFSYEGRASELHAWLAVTMAPSQQGSQEERVEEGPHDAESMKPRRGGSMQ